MSTTPNSSLPEAVRELPELLVVLRSALESGDDNQVQSKAFGLGCRLLGKLVDSIAQDLSRLDDAQKQLSGFNISMSEDQFNQFIDDEIELLKKYEFSGQGLDEFKDRLHTVEGDLGTLHFDSSEAVSALEEFRDLLCRLEGLAKEKSIPNAEGLLRTCISGVLEVATICVDVVDVVAAVPTVWSVFTAVLSAITSVKAGYLSLSRTIPRLHELIQSELFRRGHERVIEAAANHRVRTKKDSDDKT